MKTYKVPKIKNSRINLNQSVEGEPLEYKIDRILNNKEPIKDGAPIIYTERKDGVKAAYNPRTDRWVVAVEAMDKVDKSFKAKREERAKAPKKDGEPESTQGKATQGGTDGNQ